jgi:hypothetical protein
MFGLPVQALHLYRDQAATFQVRIASVKDMVDQRGEQISAAETVTLLNDWCFLAPGALVDDRLQWSPVDDRSATVTFTNGPYRVSATLIFNERDELIDFWSDDRPDTSTGEVRPMRWSTPIGDYRVIQGLRLPTSGATVYTYPDGPFTYGEFRLRSIAFDLSSPA